MKLLKIKSKRDIGVQDVYDIQVKDQHHYILEGGVVSHNCGFLFASSIVIAMKPLKLKEDAEGNKVTDVLGIRAGCKVMKTRYNKPFETIEIKIPWSTGMDPYSGLFDMFEKKGLLEKEGNRYKYIDLQGDEHKYYRKEYLTNVDSILDLIMGEYNEKKLTIKVVDSYEAELELAEEIESIKE
jgi:hypothetical protein